MGNPSRPVRLQRSRAKGSRLVSPNGLPVVCVTRGTRWGNPYRVKPYCGIQTIWCVWDAADRLVYVASDRVEASEFAIDRYREDLAHGQLGVTEEDVQCELIGKNLACWCELAAPCHADVLLAVANG